MTEIMEIDVEPQLGLGVRRKGRYREMANIFPVIFQYAVSAGARIAGPPTFICRETCEEEAMKADAEASADLEIVVPVAEAMEGTDEIKCYELPGGRMAKTVHQGPYEACKPTYDRLFAWIAENGKKIVGPIRETYLNDPREVAEDEILTEIYAPIL